MLKAEEKKSKVNEMKMKANKTRNELKVSDSNTYWLKNEERMKNERRTMKNFHIIAYGSVTEAPRLGFSSRKHIFSPKIAEMHSQGGPESFETTPLHYL